MAASALFVEAGLPEDPSRAAWRALAARIDRLIAAIDLRVTKQLGAILRAPAFRAMEARWRGLSMLVAQAGRGRGVLIRVLDVDWPTLGRNLERSTDFDQSHLFRLVYDGEFGMPGGLPFGLLLGDYQIAPAPVAGSGDQVEIMRRLAAVAAASFCPVVMNAAPQMFGFADHGEIAADTDLTAPRSDDPAMMRWNSLRRSEDARFVGLIAPGLMIRPSYRRFDPARLDGFAFDETGGGVPIIGGAFAFAAVVVQAFVESGWFAAIRGAAPGDATSGGQVPGFAPLDYRTDRHALAAQPPLEFRPTPAQEQAMSSAGVIPLSALYHGDAPVFFTNPSLHLPQSYDNPVASQNARLAAMLQYVLCTSRFAHYLKVIMRDEIGSVSDPALIEARLLDWLRGYCLGNDDASLSLKAQYPLRDAGVRISEIAGKPGSYRATIHLQPHFQLDDISTSFHLIAETGSVHQFASGGGRA
ncbi:MAG: type VI secretion system contractile sheath large subunit [Paracoccus sp. (in: a-proteobacteria)]|nr:type VI secretion system contractile sheath large subunit [Paracoccus sp. (in: a-proteobacteria)]